MQVNNVGTNIRKPTVEYTEQDYSFIMSTNFESAYHFNQLAHPLLKASGSGSIVFISSVAGVTAIQSGTLYAASKGECLDWSHLLISSRAVECTSLLCDYNHDNHSC